MSKTIIFGASHQGRIVLEILRAKGDFEVIGFLDDDTSKHGAIISGVPVLSGIDWVLSNTHKGLKAIVAIGNNEARMTIGARLRTCGLELINAVHPSAVIMAGVAMGTGNLICAGSVVVSGASLRDDVVLNTGVTIDHDCVLSSGAYVAPGVHAAGCVTIGRGAFIGIGAVLGPGVTVGDWCVVGAGSVVLSDLPPRVLAFGSPAKIVRQLDSKLDWRKILAG